MNIRKKREIFTKRLESKVNLITILSRWTFKFAIVEEEIKALNIIFFRVYTHFLAHSVVVAMLIRATMMSPTNFFQCFLLTLLKGQTGEHLNLVFGFCKSSTGFFLPGVKKEGE